MVLRKYLLAVFLAIFMTSATGGPAADSMTLEQVIAKVLEHSPLLKAHELSASAAAARIKQARLTTPVNLNLELENFSGSNAHSGSSLLETTLSLGKVLELGNKPELRGQVSRQEASLLRNKQDAKRLDLLAEATRRFLHVVVDQQRLMIAKDKLALMERTYAAVAQRVKAGRSTIAERRQAGIAHARARLELEHAEHELATSRLKLTTMWGETAPVFSFAQAALFDTQQVETFEQLARQLQHNPDIVRLATRQRLAEARYRLARAHRRADVEISGGIRHFNSTGDSAFVLSASLPLGADSRAGPAIEETQLHAQREPFDYQQRRLELHASLYGVYQELMHAATAIDVLQTQIIPQAKQVLRDYEKGYTAGRYSLLELSEAQRTLLEARREAVSAAADYHRYRVEIERLTGKTLSTGAAK
jgi:cobalt-zinc-cadmium efflux system outer membrane protein